MQLHEVEANVAGLDVSQGFELIYDLLRAYGVPSGSIARLKSGSYDKSARDNEVLWRDKVYYRYIDDGADVHAAIDAARCDDSITKLRPRFLVVCNRDQIAAMDTRTSDTLDTRLVDLPGYSAFFLPWSGIEKTELETVNYADIKAAGRMAKLYDEIVKHNQIETAQDVHNLNIFFTRLLFCFFAEDTSVFADGIFTRSLASLTAADGSDTGRFLDALFDVLDTAPDKRTSVPAHFADFGYVNGRLFAAHASAPRFSRAARQLMIQCGSLNWSVINPDIFGSMMQAVVRPSERGSLGMHYTSVENIMKVIRPLFLDDLQRAFDAADTKPKLIRLRERISAMKCFDPACGSGNFLVIAYKELRKLEHQILRRLQEIDPQAPLALFQDSHVKLENFFGIEIDHFAHEVAILSLWLAKHQMNVEFRGLFGHDIRLIPLRDAGNVVCGNAARIEWESVCAPNQGEEVYLLSNPPYLGARLQDASQKADMQSLTGVGDVSNNLDYVAIWFLLGAQYVARNRAALGFVATNSICQGEQVGLLWPRVYDLGADIAFGVQSFKWTNSARGNAGVTCVVVGLRRDEKFQRRLYSQNRMQTAEVITPYLTRADHRVIVEKQARPITPGLPPLTFGNMPNDGGHLIFDSQQYRELLATAPAAGEFVRKFVGADELLTGNARFALWLNENQLPKALAIPLIADRIQKVGAYRTASRRDATRRLAAVPHRFGEVRHQDGTAIVVPLHTSEARQYIPMAFVDERTVVSNACGVIYHAPPWLFALLTSRMHNVWVRAVAGALETRIRYSATLCYNTFPVPPLSETMRELLTERAFAVLEAREHHSDKTLAQLYDRDQMPAELRETHQFLDAAVDQLYRRRPFQSDDERLELLFDMYEAAVDGHEAEHEAELEVSADA